MRKTTKTICVILVASFLALSWVGASPSAWGWLTQRDSSATSEVQPKALTAASDTQKKDSTSSANTSGDVIVMSKSDLAAAIALIEAGSEDAKKSKMTVEEAEKMALASNAATTAYERLMRTRFLVKGLCGWDMTRGLDFGFGLGLIVKDSILIEFDATKTGGFGNWGEAKDYTFRAGIGLVF